MSFLSVTLIRIPILVLILSRGELGGSATDNDLVDGRFSFEDSNCPQSWSRQLELEPELERPSLEFRTENGTKLLDRPSPEVIYLKEEAVEFIKVKLVCRAPYPVILLAAHEDGSMRQNDGEVFHVTTRNLYNKSSYTFETRTRPFFQAGFIKQSNFYYCQAVHNPCLKSREKLLYFYDQRVDVVSLALKYYSFASNPSHFPSDSHSDSDSDLVHSNSILSSSKISPSGFQSILNGSSDSISPSEFQAIFGSTLDSDLNAAQDNERNKNMNANTSDSECEAIFYYEQLRYDGGKAPISVRYRCEFKDGTPGTVQVLRRCGNLGRCRFLVAARKKKVKNCWRPFTPGKTCLNCTAQEVKGFMTQPFIPHCYIKSGESSGGQAMEEEDETVGPVQLDKFVSVDDLPPDFGKDKDSTETSWSRSVEGTPLYIGFPPPGFHILPPFIRTDAFDQDELEEPTLVQMRPFSEIQLMNTSIQVTCESSVWYTSKIFMFALEFQSEAGKGKGKRTQKNLHFFPVDKTALTKRYFAKGLLNSQTLTIHLNRTDIVRIFCLVGVQNSFKWINASRPIRVLEYHDFYKPGECKGGKGKNSDLDLPRPEFSVFYIKLPQLDGMKFDEGHPQLFLNDGDSVFLSCSADYPIQILSTFNDTAGSGKFKDQVAKFSSYQNYSSYLFILQDFEFKPQREFQFFRCQSLEHPCVHRSVSYSYVPGPTHQLQFNHVPQKNSSILGIKGMRSKSKSNFDSGLDLEFGSPANYSECEVLFFYKELPDFPGYAFRCEFPMEEVGVVNFHYCDSWTDCTNLYRNRRQPKVCWRKVKAWRNCNFCKEDRSVGYRPFVATCGIRREVTTFTNYDKDNVDEKRMVESALASFAVFGLPNQTNGIAPIYFSNEDIEAHTTLFLEPFDKYQFLNSTLNLTCVFSAYYMSVDDVHFVKFYGGRNELEFLKFEEKLAAEKEFPVDPEQHKWRITRNVQLGHDPGLTHILCIGITWIDFKKKVNSSQEIYLQGPEGPKTVIDVKDETNADINNLLLATGNSQMSNVKQEYQVLVNSKNKTVDCHALGFPPPKIQWVTTALNAIKPQERVVNSSHSLSRIFFPVMDAGVEGTYICSAMNSKGDAKSSIEVKLRYPVDKTRVAIVTASVLIVASLSIIMAILWRTVRGLKKVLRDLTAEEVEEFHLGSRTVDPDDPLAQIYALPYDWSLEVPRELIQLDETSVLGSGQFGLVRSGYIKLHQEEGRKRLVAIKQAKPKLRAEEFKNILSEIKVMSHLKEHENVLQILAACTTSIKKCQVLVVMEFCEMGDLHKYLRDRKYIFSNIFTADLDPDSGYAPVSAITTEKLSTHTLVDFSLGIANGMSHLRQKQVVHGDLAARNVLLTQTLQVKISDFGYSTHLINYASYAKNEQAVIPWRWFSIEALKEMKLSFKSDVWAFGVLLYEIFTMGELPYSGDDLSAEFVKDLVNGKRLEKPDYTNAEIYALMTDCWVKEPSERPTFQEIYDRLLLIKNDLGSTLNKYTFQILEVSD